MTLVNDGGDMMDELGILLVRYADVALSPDRRAMDRIRQQLRADAQRASVRRRAEALAIAAVPSAPATPARRPFGMWRVRRVGLAMAASLVLGLTIGTTTFAASKAGGPLYDARLWLEELALPSDPEARLAAEMDRAYARLAEAMEAAARGDTNAMMAALAAYERIVQQASESVANDAGRDRAAVAFQNHLAVLESLLQQVPDAAKDAIQHAADRSDQARDQLGSDKPTPTNQPGSNPGRTPDPDPPTRPTPKPPAQGSGDPPGQGGGDPPGQGGQGPPDGQGGSGGQAGSPPDPSPAPDKSQNSNRP